MPTTRTRARAWVPWLLLNVVTKAGGAARSEEEAEDRGAVITFAAAAVAVRAWEDDAAALSPPPPPPRLLLCDPAPPLVRDAFATSSATVLMEAPVVQNQSRQSHSEKDGSTRTAGPMNSSHSTERIRTVSDGFDSTG